MHGGQATRESAALGRISADKIRFFGDYATRAYLKGTFVQRLLWDFRMAWSLQREAAKERFAEAALFYPALWGFMKVGAALARGIRRER